MSTAYKPGTNNLVKHMKSRVEVYPKKICQAAVTPGKYAFYLYDILLHRPEGVPFKGGMIIRAVPISRNPAGIVREYEPIVLWVVIDMSADDVREFDNMKYEERAFRLFTVGFDQSDSEMRDFFNRYLSFGNAIRTFDDLVKKAISYRNCIPGHKPWEFLDTRFASHKGLDLTMIDRDVQLVNSESFIIAPPKYKTDSIKSHGNVAVRSSYATNAPDPKPAASAQSLPPKVSPQAAISSLGRNPLSAIEIDESEVNRMLSMPKTPDIFSQGGSSSVNPDKEDGECSEDDNYLLYNHFSPVGSYADRSAHDPPFIAPPPPPVVHQKEPEMLPIVAEPPPIQPEVPVSKPLPAISENEKKRESTQKPQKRAKKSRVEPERLFAHYKNSVEQLIGFGHSRLPESEFFDANFKAELDKIFSEGFSPLEILGTLTKPGQVLTDLRELVLLFWLDSFVEPEEPEQQQADVAYFCYFFATNARFKNGQIKLEDLQGQELRRVIDKIYRRGDTYKWYFDSKATAADVPDFSFSKSESSAIKMDKKSDEFACLMIERMCPNLWNARPKFEMKKGELVDDFIARMKQ
jgi:hypothetical protein